jgi:uncharacterized lipoprotein YmbA
LAVGGCAGSSTPTSFYLLKTLPEAASKIATPSTGKNVSVLVGPVAMPVYLDRTQFVTRTGKNELDLHEFQHWAEPLTDTFYRVLMENLSILLRSPEIYMFPRYRAATVDYQLIIDVMRFDGDSAGKVSLIAFWRILNGKGTDVIVARKSVVQATALSSETESIMAAQNTVLNEFSSEIAAALQAIQQ